VSSIGGHVYGNRAFQVPSSASLDVVC
jgi:hypothetical protein